MELENIRNFCIIAHIDHGKSTLADRMLELTNTIEKRKMRAQVLDQMELERERGITIKMQPVRMSYQNYQFNLIDTPGHIDFSYEVSRALKAVEGAILLVDATQGVQAQTIANVEMAKALGLKIIPVINKIDLPSARVEETKDEIKRLLGAGNFDDILEVSAKTGEGVARLLEEVIRRVPPPKAEFADRPRALIFDFEYSLHQGVIVYIRMIDGLIRKGDELLLSATKERFVAGEVGIFSPARVQSDLLSAGEIGYIITNIKKPSIATVGDTVVSFNPPAGGHLPPLGGYMHPRPVVWASIYPESQDDFDFFRQALERLRLSDSSLVYEEEASGALGRGFRCGFLGMLHLEIIIERLKREFGLGLIVAAPTITYKIQFNDGGEKEIYSPMFFPDQSLIKKLYEPWVEAQIIAPIEKTGAVVQILYEHEAEVGGVEPFGGNRNMMNVRMPLRELMRNFFDELKSATSGYGSLNYKVAETREIEPGRIVRLDVFVAEELVPAFSRIVSKEKVQREAEDIAEKLKNLIPRELFTVKIQAKALGRILASRSIPALKKDVTGYLYGGDRTRKMKLWQKQKRGKERLKKAGRVNIPHEVFVKVMQNK
ncbi:translation elongation factor 4 [Patescibacteria group bacterium]|nr:translation elongation factor 4 [Patescibacteria group bacterium]MBU4353603.1 translation elongation factor 4 [Patescibacteria group bacterium]MCG2699297.1 translation elongation factor 4 [Candidatus Parcubacteria bacterium]